MLWPVKKTNKSDHTKTLKRRYVQLQLKMVKSSVAQAYRNSEEGKKSTLLQH